MPKRISELQRKGIERDIKAGKTTSAIAAAHRVSEGTVKRVKSALKADQKAGEVKSAVAAISQKTTLRPEDFSSVMLRLIESLTDEDAMKTPIASREGAARTATAIINQYFQNYPPSMEEAAEWLINLPGFNPGAFAAILREKYSAG